MIGMCSGKFGYGNADETASAPAGALVFWRTVRNGKASVRGLRMSSVAQIVSSARYVPDRVVTNAELADRFAALGRPDVVDRLARTTGIAKRFYASDDWATSDLALPAAKEALKRAGRKPEDVGIEVWCSLGNANPDEWRKEVTFWKNAGVTHVTAHTTYANNHHKRIAGKTAADHLAAIKSFQNAVRDLL